MDKRPMHIGGCLSSRKNPNEHAVISRAPVGVVAATEGSSDARRAATGRRSV
jgi:hypothetical protein